MTEGEYRASLFGPCAIPGPLRDLQVEPRGSNEENMMQKGSLSGHDHSPDGRHIEKDGWSSIDVRPMVMELGVEGDGTDRR